MNKKLEKNELDLLIEKGVRFKVKKTSLLQYFGKKEREFEIFQPYLGTLDYLSAQYLKLDYSAQKLANENWLNESKRLQAAHSKTCANIVAIAVLNSKWKIKLFYKFLANYFFWHLKPDKLSKIAEIILQMSNISDFTNSIRLMSIMETTTAPKLIDTAKTQGLKQALAEEVL